MKVFAVGDLHLGEKQNKPMDVFGEKWRDHRRRIFESWESCVLPGDCVLLPGDFSWAMQFSEALDDLFAVAELPGTKLLIRGNHDYWWASPTKMREALPEGMHVIQNDAFDAGAFIACGTRGWLLPGTPNFTSSDEKIFKRELIRLEMSLTAAKRLQSASEGAQKPIILMLHYPPVGENGAENGFTELIDKYSPAHVVYGHLHAQSCRSAFEGERNGTMYTLVSADHIDFEPKLIAEYSE